MNPPHDDLQFSDPAVSNPASPPANPTNEDDAGSVLDLIADVEARLRKVRDLQSDHDGQLKSLEERSHALEQTEQSLREREETLITLEQELSRIRSGLDTRAQELDGRATEIEREAGEVWSAREVLEKDRAQIVEERTRLQQQNELLNQHWKEMEAERARLSDEQQALTEARTRLEQEHAALAERIRAAESETERLRREHAEMEGRLGKAEENVGELIRQIETAQEQLEQRAREHEAASTASARASEQVGQLEQQLHEARKTIEKSESDALQMVEQVEQERDGLRAEQERLSREIAHERERAASLEAKVTEAQTAQNAAREQVEKLNWALQGKEQEINEQRKTLDAAKAKLSEFAKSIGDQARQIERGAAAIAAVREQKQEIERLRNELAQANLSGDPDEVLRKDERIAELTQALREARGQSINNADTTERDQRIEELVAEVDQLRLELERARMEAENARASASGDPLLDAASESEAIAERDQRIETLEQQIAALQARFDEARLQLEQSVARGASNDEAQTREIQRKAVRLKEIARHLQRRKLRLERMRQLLDERRKSDQTSGSRAESIALSHADTEHRAKQMDQLRIQQESLREAMRCLIISEKEMIRRWARPRAMVTLCCFVVMAGILAAGSWFATDHFFPATISASVTIEAKDRPGFPMDDQQLSAWQIWHTGKLQDAAFHKTLADRFDSRGLAALGNAEAVQQRLTNDMKFDSSRDGELVLTLAGTNSDEITSVLDTVAITLVSEARREAGKRTDGGSTVLLGERKVDGQTYYASVGRVPVKDERLVYAGSIFGGSMAVMLLFWGMIYMKLSKAKRIFDESDPLAAEHGTDLSAG